MLEIRTLFDAVLISVQFSQNPDLVMTPHPTGSGCKLLYRFPTITENQLSPFSSPNLYLLRRHLEKFDELNRLGIAAQKAWREFGEGVQP